MEPQVKSLYAVAYSPTLNLTIRGLNLCSMSSGGFLVPSSMEIDTETVRALAPTLSLGVCSPACKRHRDVLDK